MIMLTQRRYVQFDLVANTAKPRFIDGEELPDWQVGPEMVEYIRQLIEEGWNLQGGNSQVVIFERAIWQAVG